jgi:hypothetical protein
LVGFCARFLAMQSFSEGDQASAKKAPVWQVTV